ncbi:hypothetical protein BDN70DRAFT_24190 [Pholiota conissans]|uniref:Uncharacterized protein n=1 Tax=Pholiota conissans TaxID=109636 RepID=A0A9P5ZEB2_9AGAR|nr:hypothetical protein BDN70DRAFT_24190 [Pholiota conissans]
MGGFGIFPDGTFVSWFVLFPFLDFYICVCGGDLYLLPIYAFSSDAHLRSSVSCPLPIRLFRVRFRFRFRFRYPCILYYYYGICTIFFSRLHHTYLYSCIFTICTILYTYTYLHTTHDYTLYLNFSFFLGWFCLLALALCSLLFVSPFRVPIPKFTFFVCSYTGVTYAKEKLFSLPFLLSVSVSILSSFSFFTYISIRFDNGIHQSSSLSSY